MITPITNLTNEGSGEPAGSPAGPASSPATSAAENGTAKGPEQAKTKKRVWDPTKRTGLVKKVKTGGYFGRIRYKGKLIGPNSLETDDYATACDRLPIYIAAWIQKRDDAEAQKQAPTTTAVANPTTWQEATEAFKRESENMKTLGMIQRGALVSRLRDADKIAHFWPSLVHRAAYTITKDEVLDFLAEATKGGGRFGTRISPGTWTGRYRQFLGGACGRKTLKNMQWAGQSIMDKARGLDAVKGLKDFPNAWRMKRYAGASPLQPLPSEEQFQMILDDVCIKNHSGSVMTEERRFKAGGAIEFMAMSGLRLGEMLGVDDNEEPHPGLLWENIHDDVEQPYIVAICEKKRKNEKWRKPRSIPFFGGKDGPMAALIKKLREKLYEGNPKAKVFEGFSQEQGLSRVLAGACRRLELKDKEGRPIFLTNKSLRHLFATRCVEGNVTWKALAEWLGHEDGGILAASTYSHLRDERSWDMASRLGQKKGTGAPAGKAPAPVEP